jgi:glycosyltransferase involved in cell wall biosynthesis
VHLNPLVVIPVFNNIGTLRSVAEKSLASGFPVLVVNDGCTDGSAGTLDGLDCFRLDFKRNRGKGAAIKAAARWAGDRGYTHIITLDADGQHHPEDIPVFAGAAAAHPRSLIIGSRDFSDSVIPGISRFGRNFSNFWIWASSGKRVPDSQSGFRVYPCPVLNQLRIRADRYNFEVEIIVRSVWSGIDVRSVDIDVLYTEETRAASHFRRFRDNARISASYLLLLFTRVFPSNHRRIVFPGTNC